MIHGSKGKHTLDPFEDLPATTTKEAPSKQFYDEPFIIAPSRSNLRETSPQPT